MARKPINKSAWSSPLVAKDMDDLMEEYTSRLEKQVAHESRFFRLMADAMPQIVWTAQSSGKADYFNKRWYEYTGMTESASLARGWISMVHKDDLPRNKVLWAAAVKNSSPFESELRFKESQGGGSKWFLVRALPGHDNAGKTIKWFGTCTDIDEHKKAQTNKDEFIAITSHELKTPLTSLKAFNQLLHFQMENSGQNDLLIIVEKMNAQINRLNNLINDLLEISLLDTGKLRLNKQRFSFDRFVRDVVDNMQFISNGHQLVVKGRSNLTVYADKDRLEQAFANLISNAVKYSPDADKVIISLGAEKGKAKISVTDFGLGIPKRDQANIFERFFRVEGAKYESFSGFGLGLYIASEILKIEGGKLWVDSQVGKGSTFSVLLPAAS